MRDYLDPLLHPEGEVRENGQVDVPVRPWQGFSPTRTDREPVEQLQSLAAAQRFSAVNGEYGADGDAVAFVAEGFPALNARADEDPRAVVAAHEPAADRKQAVLSDVADAMDLDLVVTTTRDVWSDPAYWDALRGHLEDRYGSHAEMIDLVQTTRMAVGARDGPATPAEDVLDAVDAAYGVDASGMLSDYLAAFEDTMGRPMQADWLYVPAEQAVARYLADAADRNLKMGPRSERHYDDGIDFQGVVHLAQPAALDSSMDSPSTVIPYIADESGRDARILVGDDPATIREKVERADADHVYAGDGTVRNPIVENAVLAADLAYAMGADPVEADGTALHDGYAVMDYAEEHGREGVEALRGELPDALDRTVNRAAGTR